MQHNTFNDFHSDTSCCFLTSTFNDFSMTQPGIFCAREQKILKKLLVNKLFMDTLLLLCFSPLEEQNLSSNSHLFSPFHIFAIRTMSIYNNEQWDMSIKHVVINRINFLRNGTQPFPKFRRNTHLMGSN